MDFRVLVVDDRSAQDVVDLIEGNKVLKAPDSIICEICTSFEDALERLRTQRYDLVTLDLKDDGNFAEASANPDITELAGERLYQRIKETRFIPVVFYTGFAYKIEGNKPFVRVVTRTEVQQLRSEIKSIFDTKLPLLIRHLEEEMRLYMWESIEQLWPEDEVADPNDIVYLIARRLGNLLQGDILRDFLKQNGAVNAEKTVHPVEMYIWPPVTIKSFFFGDILQRSVDGVAQFYVIVTPSCDLQQSGKAEFVIVGNCKLLSECKESQKAKAAIQKKVDINDNGELKGLIKTNKERVKFLPGTNFLPDLVLDLQNLSSVTYAELSHDNSQYKKIASLDTPFAEALQSQLSRYYGRIGTPDLNADIAYSRAIKALA